MISLSFVDSPTQSVFEARIGGLIGLRALLIQKDVKHCSRTLNILHTFLLKKYSQTF